MIVPARSTVQPLEAARTPGPVARVESPSRLTSLSCPPTVLERLYLRYSKLLDVEYGAVCVHSRDRGLAIPIIHEALRDGNTFEDRGVAAAGSMTTDSENSVASVRVGLAAFGS
jgi:hypothetical protein